MRVTRLEFFKFLVGYVDSSSTATFLRALFKGKSP